MRILVADHHQLFREALVRYMERARIAETTVTVTDLIAAKDQLARKDPCDIVLIDDQLPGLDHIEDIGDLLRRFAAVKFIVLSEDLPGPDRMSLIKCGLWGYFPKTMSGRDMIDALQEIQDGKKRLGPVPCLALKPAIPEFDRYFFRSSEHDSNSFSVAGPPLTDREQDVLNHLVRGQSNAEIASELGIQLVTVKLHMRNLTRKLGARNRTEAALMAQERGMIRNNRA